MPSATIRPLSGQNKLTNYAAAVMATTFALQFAIRELAKLHDNKPGPWLDELEQRALAEAAGMRFSDGAETHMEEAKIFATDLVISTFGLERQSLIEKSGDVSDVSRDA